MYDLTVAEDHEFFADGVLVHNSLGFNYLFDRISRSGELPLRRVDYQVGGKKRLPPCRFVVIEDKSRFAEAPIDEPHLLVYCTDPAPAGAPESYEVPAGARPRRIAHVVIPCVDRTAEELQPEWDRPVDGYGKRPEQILIDRELCRRLWGFLTRRYDPPPKLVVFLGDGPEDGRPLSMAMGACDALNYGRDEGFLLLEGQDDNRHQGTPPNRYVADMVRKHRGTVTT